MVFSQEKLDLFCQEAEQLLRALCGHELLGDGNLGVGEVERGVAVQLDRADPEVRSSKIDGEVEALRTSQNQPCALVGEARSRERGEKSYLLGAIGNTGDVGGDLAHAGAILLQPEIWDKYEPGPINGLCFGSSGKTYSFG